MPGPGIEPEPFGWEAEALPLSYIPLSLAAILNLTISIRFFLSKCVYDVYFRSQEIKTHQISYFIRKIPSFAKNDILAAILYFLTPYFYRKLMT